MKTGKSRRRSGSSRNTPRKNVMVEALRREIVAGTFNSGERLPNQVKLAERHGVSVVTAQTALSQLESEGFIISRHRVGRHVSETPPYLYHYGLVYPFGQKPVFRTRMWSLYYQALMMASIDAQQNGTVMQQFFGAGMEPAESSRLEQLMTNNQLAGVIFVNILEELETSPILTSTPDMPKISLDNIEVPGIVHVKMDHQKWLQLAAETFYRRGCKRVALLSLGQFWTKEATMEHVFNDFNVEVPPGSTVTPGTFTVSGDLLMDAEPYAGANVKEVIVGPGDDSHLSLYLPGSQIFVSLELDEQGRLSAARLVTPGHLITRTFVYPNDS